MIDLQEVLTIQLIAHSVLNWSWQTAYCELAKLRALHSDSTQDNWKDLVTCSLAASHLAWIRLSGQAWLGGFYLAAEIVILLCVHVWLASSL